MMSLLSLIARAMVGLIFAYAGLNKLLEPVENFQVILSNDALIPSFLAPMIAHILPWIEWMGGGLLILGYAPRQISFLLGSVSLMFLLSLATHFIFRGSLIKDCGCFGERGLHLSSVQMLAIDIFNLLILTSLFFVKHFPFSLHNWLKKSKNQNAKCKI